MEGSDFGNSKCSHNDQFPCYIFHFTNQLKRNIVEPLSSPLESGKEAESKAFFAT
jgi:hypothetical protein